MTDEIERRLTIDDVAKAAGVSRSTVSLVLRNSELVAEHTKTTVREVAARLGYVYNRKAAIRSRFSYLVGIIIPDLTNPFFSELTAGVDQVLNDAGWTSLLGNSWESVSNQERIFQRMHEQDVDALIVCPVTDGKSAATESFTRSGFRTLQVLRRADQDTSYLGIDYAHGVSLAVNHLYELGHTNIVFLGGERAHSAATERYDGYVTSMRSHGLIPRHVPCSLKRSAAAETVGELLRMDNPPSAFVCFNDVVAIGAMAGLERIGRKVGHDVSVVGFDNVADAEFVQPPLTTVDTHARQLGEQAARLVLDGIRKGLAIDATTITKTSLVVRSSTGKARGLL
ncbi:LacI family DNA-binding transcriptional regulator [Rhizobium sp. LEGMi135b]